MLRASLESGKKEFKAAVEVTTGAVFFSFCNVI